MTLVAEKCCSPESINLRPCLMCFCHNGHLSDIVSTAERECVTPSRCDPNISKLEKFVRVDVLQEGFLSHRRLSIRFFSKALVGEHTTLSFLYGMAMILTLPCSPARRFVRTLQGYCIHTYSDLFHHTNIVEHALLQDPHCSRSYSIGCSVCPSSTTTTKSQTTTRTTSACSTTDRGSARPTSVRKPTCRV